VARPNVKDFYPPREIYFTIDTSLWLIQNLGILGEGHWPPDTSSYIDPGIINKTSSGKAPFVTPIEFAAEIEARLEKCGVDGLILEAIECWGKSEESMSKYLCMPLWSIRRRYKTALYYISSGPARRWHTTKKREGETYREFKRRPKDKSNRLASP